MIDENSAELELTSSHKEGRVQYDRSKKFRDSPGLYKGMLHRNWEIAV